MVISASKYLLATVTTLEKPLKYLYLVATNFFKKQGRRNVFSAKTNAHGRKNTYYPIQFSSCPNEVLQRFLEENQENVLFRFVQTFFNET